MPNTNSKSLTFLLISFLFFRRIFASNRYLSSQLGYVLILNDTLANASLLHYNTCKSRRVARSALVAELFALSTAFDMAGTVWITLNGMFDRCIPINVFLDSNSLFDGIIGIKPTAEKTLLIDLSVLLQIYERREIADVIWIPTEQNPADALT